MKTLTDLEFVCMDNKSTSKLKRKKLLVPEDLREEAKSWRDEYQKQMKIIQENVNFGYDDGQLSFGFQKYKGKIEFINHFFNLNEEGKE